jgi:CRISPR/Cas system-associated exonuclease Cas4 (RecB family)
MKAFWVSISVALLFWGTPAAAEYCTVKSAGKETSCIFKTKRTPKDTQVVISYTQQGWSMMVAVFLKEFAMIEGDSRVEIKNGPSHSIEYVSTRRDMTINRRLMEAPVYLVSEELLHDLGSAKGKARFWLSAEKPKEVEVEIAASLFEDIDAYIEETKEVLAELFQPE